MPLPAAPSIQTAQTHQNLNGGNSMKTINLREFYPFYHSDLFIEVSDEVAEALVEARRYEWRVLRRVAYHRAYFSLDAGDDIERDALFRAMSPCEIYERKLTIEQLYAAIDALPEKQARAKASKQANEDARFVLPNACESKMVVTMNARSLQNFFHLRCCSRAQWEIRQLAEEMLRLVYPVAPHIFRTAGPACVSGPCPEGKMCCGRTAEVRAQYAALKGEKAE